MKKNTTGTDISTLLALHGEEEPTGTGKGRRKQMEIGKERRNQERGGESSWNQERREGTRRSLLEPAGSFMVHAVATLNKHLWNQCF